MERKITKRMEEWKDDPDHKPLILTGCRQIGKTYSALEFARTHYRSYIYINFETNPEKKTMFEGSLEYDDLIPKLLFSEKVELVEGESVIIFDEIHSAVHHICVVGSGECKFSILYLKEEALQNGNRVLRAYYFA